ncbi:hypothetical protein KUTeg_010276 [Tegillarca granosa]|uniref:DNA repair protein RAD51 homolog 3 n=1 Tax=Tegillarca granosa TaxID=220873 RepID=A0ABQ9F6B2_TEGGR|nr:hypothetical protein KUTeg_010276 [Tegillarca granosa]
MRQLMVQYPVILKNLSPKPKEKYLIANYIMQLSKELNTFSISGLHKGKLQTAGYLVCEDLKDTTASDLGQGISVEDAKGILDLVFSKSQEKVTAPNSAYDLVKDEQSTSCIVTFCEKIDTMLGGGVPLSKITEICGVPGIGKTHMQLAVDVQMPEEFGGLNGEALYIDTEGSFIVDRILDIAKATIDHCKTFKDDEDTFKQFTIDYVLSRIHYFRCQDYTELLAIIQLLPEFIHQHSNVKLIIVDSVAYPFKHDFEDLYHRTRILTKMAQNLRRIATENKLAVVLTNQMTTKLRHGKDSQLIPALGETWAYSSTIRMILKWEGKVRMAWLYKSPITKGMTVPYQITMGGVRDVIEPNTLGEKKYLAYALCNNILR